MPLIAAVVHTGIQTCKSVNRCFFILKRVSGAGQRVDPVPEGVQRTDCVNTLRLAAE